MESLSHFAHRVLLKPSLAEKLRPPVGDLTDAGRPAATIVEEPARPRELQFSEPRSAPTMPKFAGFHEPERRGLAHHIMANHELQALEIMAATLLRYPDAPAEFRIGLGRIMQDEQRHTRMHIGRAEKLGIPFGSRLLNGYIWRKSCEFSDLLDYLAGLPLVFEGANLDHSLEFADAFESVGDHRSANVMRQIHDDEIDHVAFGIKWLRVFKPSGATDWETFVKHLHYPLRAEKARGDVFQEEARRSAGLGEDFIENMKNVEPFPPRPKSTNMNSQSQRHEEKRRG